MPLAEMQASGSNAYVAQLLTMGYTYSQVQERLAVRFGTETPGELSRAASYGLEAWRAASRLEALPSGEAIPGGALRFSPGALPGYRYYLNVGLVGPSVPEGSVRRLVVDSPQSLSLVDLAHQAQALFEEAYGPAGARRGYEGFTGAVMLAGLDVIGVERG